ncbi:hypothetical protein JOY44_28690 (plasmid) [Phormidium sp. CLA17]|uniref:DUF6519 domain-containing protein n=1 Tax=Leptolyngbya sp. Cla-17 TaxID=2803751 RepID=UPI0014929EE4|nr:DUF6519 domain-containing protein [Leptolyngbya sp. Cla-17]MBM0745405.1 hypothetical protein [Leptolyngbya sp. Cla-17]
MGNFSRDTFDPLKRYASVRLQQGVPLIDADWNEMDDIRRTELRTFIKWFIGDGIPAKSDGSRNDAFRIAAIPTPDSANFRILAGGGTDDSGANRCLVDGVEVFITQDIEFKAQPLHESYAGSNSPVAPDATPVDPNAPKIAGIPTTAGSYLVYLDVWEWEVGASEDNAHLVNPAIGVETCVRLKRSWIVRVFQAGAENRLPNHSYYLLATINRPTDGATITPEQITDQRRTELNLSKYLKTPIYAQQGSTVIDNQALSSMFSQLRNALRNRLASQTLFVDAAPSDLDRTLVYFTLQDVFQICTSGITQVLTNNVSISDVFQLMQILADAQENFLKTLDQHGSPSSSGKGNFINRYRRNLNLLKDEITASSLINTYSTQKNISVWLFDERGRDVASMLRSQQDRLARGAVQAMYQKFPFLARRYGSIEMSSLSGVLRVLLLNVAQAAEEEGTSSLDAAMNELKRSLNSVGDSPSWYIEALEFMKANHGITTSEFVVTANSYFDYAINALS